MSIQINGNVSYAGRVLETYEENHYDDSDFCALVWDDDENKIKRIEYDTTRFGGRGYANVDATPEVMHKARRYMFRFHCRKIGKEIADDALNPGKGKLVRIDRGRKYKGKIGIVFWIGVNQYASQYNQKYNIGVRTESGETFFCPIEYAKVLDAGDWLKYTPLEIAKRAVHNAHVSFQFY
jgi:hypothetical protein